MNKKEDRQLLAQPADDRKEIVTRMKSPRHYIRNEKESKSFAIVMLVIMVILIAWAVWSTVEELKVPEWPEPDTVHPMVNAHVSWEQTNYPGGMKQ